LRACRGGSQRRIMRITPTEGRWGRCAAIERGTETPWRRRTRQVH
jgi:hypothetical protein